MRVPLFDLEAQHAPIAAELAKAIERVTTTQRFVQGPEVERFERSLSEHCGAKQAIGCASGTDALLLSLMSAGIGPGDRVICPAFSFFSTASVIARLGAEAVFADVDPQTLCLGVEQAEAALARVGTASALIAVHLFGATAPMEGLQDFCEQQGLTVIEDAAQAIDARDESGQVAGTRGDYGCISFYPTKNLGAYGDGGIIFTQESDRGERLRQLREHGEGPAGEYHLAGLNSRLDAIQAAILRVKLGQLSKWNRARQSNASLYDECFDELGGGVGVGDYGERRLPLFRPRRPVHPAQHVYHHYVVRVPAENRESLRRHLSELEVGTGVYYPLPLHLQPYFAERQSAPLHLPEAEAASHECLALPVHPTVSREQIQYVVDSIRRYFEDRL